MCMLRECLLDLYSKLANLTSACRGIMCCRVMVGMKPILIATNGRKKEESGWEEGVPFFVTIEANVFDLDILKFVFLFPRRHM